MTCSSGTKVTGTMQGTTLSGMISKEYDLAIYALSSFPLFLRSDLNFCLRFRYFCVDFKRELRKRSLFCSGRALPELGPQINFNLSINCFFPLAPSLNEVIVSHTASVKRSFPIDIPYYPGS